MTSAELRSLGVNVTLAEKYAAPLTAAMVRHNISTPLRQAHFMAQVLHESGMLRYTQELADGSAYEGRKDLGNTETSDGKKFKGRGFIQITGRKTYVAYGESCAIDLLGAPEKVAEPQLAADSAGWFWTVFKKDSTGKNLNAMADDDQFLRITYFVNGGFNGLADRFKHLRDCFEVFGVDSPDERLQKVIANALLNIGTPERKGMNAALFRALPTVEAVNELGKAVRHG